MSKNNKSNILFRTSMSGFNKEDVNKYIQDENIRFAALESEYTDKINELQRELDLTKAEIARLNDHYEEYLTLQKETEDLRTALDAANESVKEKETKIKELTDKLETADAKESDDGQKLLDLMAENAELRENYIIATTKIEEYEITIANLRETVAELSAENTELKEAPSESYNNERTLSTPYMTDEDKNRFGDMLLRAKYASEDMLKRAEEGACIIIDRAKDEMFNYRNEAVRAAREIFGAATEELRRTIGICMNDFATAVRNSKNDPERTSKAADNCDDDLSRRIERMQNDLDRAIADKLAEFDKRK